MYLITLYTNILSFIVTYNCFMLIDNGHKIKHDNFLKKQKIRKRSTEYKRYINKDDDIIVGKKKCMCIVL